MKKYKIFETEQFLNDLKHDFSGRQKKIESKLSFYVYPELQKQPFYGKNIKKLFNYTPDTWRYRIGDYRFFYTIDKEEKTIYMLTIHHRKDSY